MKFMKSVIVFFENTVRSPKAIAQICDIQLFAFVLFKACKITWTWIPKRLFLELYLAVVLILLKPPFKRVILQGVFFVTSLGVNLDVTNNSSSWFVTAIWIDHSLRVVNIFILFSCLLNRAFRPFYLKVVCVIKVIKLRERFLVLLLVEAVLLCIVWLPVFKIN